MNTYLFEVNTKYTSSSVFKTSEVSRVCSTSENSDVFNSGDEIYLVFTIKSRFSFYFIPFTMSHPLKKDVLKMKNKNVYQTQIILVPKHLSRSY